MRAGIPVGEHRGRHGDAFGVQLAKHRLRACATGPRARRESSTFPMTDATRHGRPARLRRSAPNVVPPRAGNGLLHWSREDQLLYIHPVPAEQKLGAITITN